MITYGINTFTWTSPFRTKDLPLLDKAKAMGFDLVEIAPPLDVGNMTVRAGMVLLTAMLGYVALQAGLLDQQ